MSKPKLVKFAEIATFRNVLRNVSFENPMLINCENSKVDYKGTWCIEYFNNNSPLILELACGKGDYTIGLAQRYPERNFIGVDLKGNRLWTGARKALDLNLENAAFIRTRIELLPFFFAPSEVSEIWITFPDPFRRESKSNRRLTSPFFLEKYRQICRPDALVHLKTDDKGLFEYSYQIASTPPCRLLEVFNDVYNESAPVTATGIQTFYEKMHLAEGRVIRYLKFQLNSQENASSNSVKIIR